MQEKYQSIREEAEYARSRRSQISKTASRVARSGAPQSMVGSAALMRERLAKDFGIGVEKLEA